MSTSAVLRMGCAAALLAIAAGAATAQPVDKRTFFTFSQPVAVPGVTLPAGKYLFRLANADTSQDVVQVLSADGKKPYAMFFAWRPQRPDAPSDPEIRFMETAAGMPRAVRTWWYPGLRSGYEFVYPKNQARLLAKGTGQPVLTTQAETTTPPTTETKELARIAPSGEQAAIQPEAAPAQPVGPDLRGEVAPPSIAVPESVQARAALPKTGSSTPVVALAGVILLLGAGLIRGVRLLRG